MVMAQVSKLEENSTYEGMLIKRSNNNDSSNNNEDNDSNNVDQKQIIYNNIDLNSTTSNNININNNNNNNCGMLLGGLLPDLSVLIDAAMSETEGLKEELEEANNINNSINTSMDISISSSTTTTTTTTPENNNNHHHYNNSYNTPNNTTSDVNMTMNSSNDTVEFNMLTSKTLESSSLEHSPIINNTNITIVNSNSNIISPSSPLPIKSTIIDDKHQQFNNSIFNSKISHSTNGTITTSTNGTNNTNSSNGHSHLTSSSPSTSSFKDYEISKLPLRKRHLVPDNVYYNVYQHICISPQSPTARPPTLANTLNGSTHGITNHLGNSKSSFSQFEQANLTIDNEQRVPSPKSTSSLDSNEFLRGSSFFNSTKLNTEDDDIDVEGVDEEITVNKKVKVKKELTTNVQINNNSSSNNNAHNNHPKKKIINNNSNSQKSNKLIIKEEDDDDDDDKMEIIIESPPKLKNGNSHPTSHITPLELSKSQGDDDEIDILDDDDSTTKKNHHKDEKKSIKSHNNNSNSNSNNSHNHHHHHHHQEEENLTIHHSRENIKIEPPPRPRTQNFKDNRKSDKKRPINKISTKDSATSKSKDHKNSNKKLKVSNNSGGSVKVKSELNGSKEKLSDKETDTDSSMSESNDSNSDSDDSNSSSESDSEPEEQKNRLYCLCKKKYDAKQFMIACDKCDEWYHGECVNISEKDAKRIKSYVCIKCKRKEKISQLSINVHNNHNNNSSSNNQKILGSPKLSPTNNITDKKRINNSSSHLTSPIISSPISPTLSPMRNNNNNSNSNDNNNHTHNHHTTPLNTSPIISSPSSPTNSDINNNNSKCKFSKCTGIALLNSKYCSKECSLSNAKEFLNKNPNLQKELLSGSNNQIANITIPATPTPTPQPSIDTQKLLSTMNEDNDKLKAIIVKRQEVETKLKKLEKKTNDFEKLIHQTKLKIESNPSFFLNQQPKEKEKETINHDNNVKIDPMYNNNTSSSSITTTVILTSSTSNILNSPISPSAQINAICIYPMKESTTGFCGIIRCTSHNGWEKKRKDLFSREHNFHTKTLRDLSLEEKQIHQRIARRNKITQQNNNINTPTTNQILNNNSNSTSTTIPNINSSRDSLEV